LFNTLLLVVTPLSVVLSYPIKIIHCPDRGSLLKDEIPRVFVTIALKIQVGIKLNPRFEHKGKI